MAAPVILRPPLPPDRTRGVETAAPLPGAPHCKDKGLCGIDLLGKAATGDLADGLTEAAWDCRTCAIPLDLLQELPSPPAACCMMGTGDGIGTSCLERLPTPKAAPAAEWMLAGSTAGTFPGDIAGMLMPIESRAGPPLAAADTACTPPAPRSPRAPSA